MVKKMIKGISNDMLIIGGLAAGAAALYILHSNGMIPTAGAMAGKAAKTLPPLPDEDFDWERRTGNTSYQNIEEMIFTAVLDNADRPATVLKNEDRVRETIRMIKPLTDDLKAQVKSGRMTTRDLIKEIRATSMLIHEHLDIPPRMGAEKSVNLDYDEYPAKYGHRNKRAEQRMIDHGGVSRGDPDDDDKVPSTSQMMSNAYPAHKIGFGKKKDDDFDPPGFNRGWELGRGNPHDDNIIPIVPRPPGPPSTVLPVPRPFPGRGRHLGWTKGKHKGWLKKGKIRPMPGMGIGIGTGNPSYWSLPAKASFPGKHKGWFKNKKRKIPPGRHLGWFKGRGNPHRTLKFSNPAFAHGYPPIEVLPPRNMGMGKDPTHGQNQLPPGHHYGWQRGRYNPHRLATAAIVGRPPWWQ